MTPPALTFTAPANQLVAADAATRQLAGIACTYMVHGYTSIGRRRILAGALQLPGELRRVKLMDYHQEPPAAIGYLAAAEDGDDGLRAVFKVARTPLGDLALLEASEGVRDGLSVELADVLYEDPNDPELVTSARLTGVSLVPVPAFAGSYVDSIAAAHNPTLEGNTMTPEQRARLAALIAQQNLTDEERAELDNLTQLAVAEATAADEDPETPPADSAAPVAAGHTPQLQAGQPAVVPNGLGAVRRRAGERPINDLYASMARVFSGVSRPELEAALSDITSTANIWTARDAYAGQLWSGLEFQRRFVPLLAHDNLTSYKGTGWRWVTKPEVDDYAGDKAAVPSNAVETESVPYTAARLAGAHDLDRKFVDFGDSEFIAAYYAAMRESYARKSDAKARAFILASAAAGGAAGTTMFHAAAVASQAVSDNTDGAAVDYILVNSADALDLLDMTEADIPAYLKVFGVDLDKFIITPGQVAGTVTAGTKQAGTFYELGETPIRVEAVNIVNGGVDGGVFGYYATLLHHESAIVKATFAATP